MIDSKHAPRPRNLPPLLLDADYGLLDEIAFEFMFQCSRKSKIKSSICIKSPIVKNGSQDMFL